MPLPASWTEVPITGTYTYRNGTPLAGKSLSFTSAQVVVIGGETIVPKVIKARLNDDGAIPDGFVLPSTNDEDLDVTGWAYTVKENWPGGREFDIFVEHDAGTIDMASVSPVVTPAELVSIEAAAMASAVWQAAEASADAAAASASAASDSADAASQAAATAAADAEAAVAASVDAAAASAVTAEEEADRAVAAAEIVVNEYGIMVIADAGAVDGGYPAARSIPRTQTMTRVFAEVIEGDGVTFEVRVNGVAVYGPVAVTTTHEATVSIPLAAGDEINFDCLFDNVTRFWAQIDGAAA